MAVSSVDERLLVQAHKGGDPDAFADIVREFTPGLFAHAVMRLGDPRAAEDAVQETFLRAYRALGAFNGEYHLRAWLHRILTNVCFDENDRKRRDNALVERLQAIAPDDPLRPDEVWDLSDPNPRAVGEALEQIPDQYREALELRYVENLSMRQLAEATGVSEENARARVHRGRRALRRLLGAPLGVLAFLVPALRKSERIASATSALGPGDAATSAAVSQAATTVAANVTQAAPFFTRVAVEVSGPLSTKAGLVAGVVAAAGTVAVPAVGTSVVEGAWPSSPPPATQTVAAPVQEPAAPVVVNPAPADAVAPAAVEPAAPVTSAPATAASVPVAEAPTGSLVHEPTFSDPNQRPSPVFGGPVAGQTGGQAATAGTTETSAPPVDGSVSPSAPAQSEAPPTSSSPAPVPAALDGRGLTTTLTDDTVQLSGRVTFGTTAATVDGTLTLTPGAAPQDPVVLDGTLTIESSAGRATVRIRARVVVAEASGLRSLTISQGRYTSDGSMPDGLAAIGTVTGSLTLGETGSSLALTLR